MTIILQVAQFQQIACTQVTNHRMTVILCWHRSTSLDSKFVPHPHTPTPQKKYIYIWSPPCNSRFLYVSCTFAWFFCFMLLDCFSCCRMAPDYLMHCCADKLTDSWPCCILLFLIDIQHLLAQWVRWSWNTLSPPIHWHGWYFKWTRIAWRATSCSCSCEMGSETCRQGLEGMDWG